MSFVEITSGNKWFELHPEKVAGVEVESNSFYFPIRIKGTKEDVLRVTGFGKTSKPNNSKIKGVTVVDISKDGKTLRYGTKNNQTIVSVKGFSNSRIKEELDSENETLEYNRKYIKKFDKNAIEWSRTMTLKEKADAIKNFKETQRQIDIQKEIIIPFFKSQLKTDKRIRIAKAKAKAIMMQL